MAYKVLAEMGFRKTIMEANAQTQTGAELIKKYQVHLMANAESCGVINQFVREAAQHRYDNGVNEALATVADYIQSNKVSWALASACESIKNSNSRYNMLNLNAAHQVETLLEQEEDQVIKHIRSGSLKNVMYCESFRGICKSVFADRPVIEAKADYTKVTPVSLVESVGDGHCFVVAGQLYKTDDAGNILECGWNEVSNTFKTISALLNSKLVTIDENNIYVKYAGVEYVINEENAVTKKVGEESRQFTVEQFREHARLSVLASNPRQRTEISQVLESIALLSENYSNVATLDHVGIYTTAHDKFVIIESGNNLFSTLLASDRHPKWSVNEDAVKTLSWIKSKTNVELGEEYKNLVESCVENASAQEKEQMEQQLKEDQEKTLKERIGILTERYKDDPVKLQILAKLASEISEL